MYSVTSSPRAKRASHGDSRWRLIPLKNARARSADRTLDWLRDWRSELEFVTIGIAKVKVPFSPRCISRAVWIASFFLKGLPACIHVGNMKDHSPPRDCRTTTLQVDDWRFSIRNAQRRESRIGAAVQEVQPKHILIKTYGALHIGDDEGNRRNLLNERLHNRISVALSQPRTSWNCCSRCTHTS